jgi:hypothetical protein
MFITITLVSSQVSSDPAPVHILRLTPFIPYRKESDNAVQYHATILSTCVASYISHAIQAEPSAQLRSS